MRDNREIIKSEFRYYLANVARSARRTSEGFNLGRTAVDSFMSFLEPERLFDYAPEKWSHIKSIYDITDPNEVKQIADNLLNDSTFIEHDAAKNQGWRSGAISHYVCFINARSFFRYKENERNSSFNAFEQSLQQIFYGAPGTGKSHCIKDDAAVKEADKKNLVIRTTFHPDSDYSTFVGAYKPTSIEVPVMTIIGKEQMPVVNAMPEKKIIYSFVPQAFLQAYVAAWNNPDDKVFLVIEEINRGNCAQIFGDLFQLLDRDENGWSEYPIMADKDLAKYLNGNDESNQPVLTNKDGIKDGKLCLPKNLHIWATMNTSDQSLFPIDSAFKRRWDWVYMPIEDAGKNWKIEVNGHEYDWYRFLTAINKEVFDLTHSEDKQLGYFFAKAKGEKIDATTLVNKVYFYLWTDVFKDYDFESQKAFKKADGNEAIAFKEFFLRGNVNEPMAEQVLINLGLNKPNEPTE